MKSLSFYTLVMLTATLTNNQLFSLYPRVIDRVSQLEENLDDLDTQICYLRNKIANGVSSDLYVNYPNKRAQELIARLGLREFNSSINPFTHVGRYMDKNPSTKKQNKLRAELCQIIQEQELRPYQDQHNALEKELRCAVIQRTLAILEQKNCYQLSTQEIKQLKILKRIVDPCYRKKITGKIDEYSNQISRLRSEISSLRASRELMFAQHHSSCMVCLTCHKRVHTCTICHTCVDHCSCISYQIARDVLTILADISAQVSIDTLRQHVAQLEVKRTKLEGKLKKLDNLEKAIWHDYLKNKLSVCRSQLNTLEHPAHSYSYGCGTATQAHSNVLQYQIDQLEQMLGYARPYHNQDGPNPALVGLGCAAIGIGVLALCCSNN